MSYLFTLIVHIRVGPMMLSNLFLIHTLNTVKKSTGKYTVGPDGTETLMLCATFHLHIVCK